MRTALCVQPPEKGSSAAPVRASPCFDGRSDGPQMAMPLAGRDEVCPGSGVERPFSWSQSIVVPAKRGWARWRPVAVSQNPHQRTRPKLGGGQRSPESGRGVTHQQRDCMHRMRHSHLHTPICTHTYTHLHTHTQRYTSAKSLRGAKRVCTLATYCPPRGMEHIYTHTHTGTGTPPPKNQIPVKGPKESADLLWILSSKRDGVLGKSTLCGGGQHLLPGNLWPGNCLMVGNRSKDFRESRGQRNEYSPHHPRTCSTNPV